MDGTGKNVKMKRKGTRSEDSRGIRRGGCPYERGLASHCGRGN
jgi:hypothetical protein